MPNAFFFSNIAVPATLSGAINAADLSATVNTTVGWPTSYPYIVAIDFGASNEELVKVTANSLNTLTIERAFGGTSAASHSISAVVRHVFNAQDATDFRTHEAASSGVHGLTGAVVGTTDTQTLTNKTLSGGTFSGAFAGTPTFNGDITFNTSIFVASQIQGSPAFTGNPAFSGTVTHTGLIQSTRATAVSVALAAQVTADTFDRFRIYTDGLQEWGPGGVARDTNLYRSAANELKTDDALVVANGLTVTGLSALVERSTGASNAYRARISGDTDSRFLVNADGATMWGPGNAASDTNLYRESAGVLKTDGGLKVGGALTNTSTGMIFNPYQTGTASVTMTAQSFVTQTVTFPVAFTAAPRVVLTQRGSQSGTSALKVSADSTSTTSFVLRTADVNGANQTVTTNVDWFAVTP